MSKADKILQQMQNNPFDWRVESLKIVATAYNFNGFEDVDPAGAMFGCIYGLAPAGIAYSFFMASTMLTRPARKAG